MREIKFRAWDNVKNKMHYVGEEEEVVFHFDSNGIVATDITESEDEFKTLHHLVYMQYPGLKDRNGVEIYEGDILRSYNEFGEAFEHLSVVEYDVSLARFKGIDIKYTNYEEVIGNIYENPFLIKQ